MILDVLAGGGPFSAPRLWGPYDQVLNANIRMDLMMGDGLKDGMGLLQASYKIGLMPVMRNSTKNYYGELYSRAIPDGLNVWCPIHLRCARLTSNRRQASTTAVEGQPVSCAATIVGISRQDLSVRIHWV